MKHFNQVENKKDIFYIEPTSFNKYTKKELLAISLGAALYTKGTDKQIANRIINKNYPALTTSVLCLEDSIQDDEVLDGEANVITQLELLSVALEESLLTKEDVPLIFIRIRDVSQLKRLLKKGHNLKLVAGFNIPKFSSKNGREYLKTIKDANLLLNEDFYAMPILESEDVIYKECREKEFKELRNIFDNYRDVILNIRIGGTDFSSLYGLRRGVDFTIYDISVIRDVITDIINYFGRATESYTISGVVWEYFTNRQRVLKSEIRKTPFTEEFGEDGADIRKTMISKELDGLIKEVMLDKSNGLSGKTIIHPSHIEYVNALQVVTFEEYQDALSIINSSGGVLASSNKNKMNETKPHTAWAKKIILRSEIFGVLKEGEQYAKLF